MTTTETALVFIAVNSFFWTLSLLNLQMDLREIRRQVRDSPSTSKAEGT